MRYGAAALVIALGVGPALSAQTPVPFPKPGDPKPPAQTSGKVEPPTPQKPGTAAPAPGAVPTDATLGLPIYPSAEFLSSYDAGRGQR